MRAERYWVIRPYQLLLIVVLALSFGFLSCLVPQLWGWLLALVLLIALVLIFWEIAANNKVNGLLRCLACGAFLGNNEIGFFEGPDTAGIPGIRVSLCSRCKSML